jgi:prolipoprotein diacylglyceryl transferase
MVSLFSYITWNVNPELFKLGPLTVRWYGVLFALAFYCGFFIVHRMFRVEHKNENALNSLLIYMVAGAVVGARLGHCLFYEPDYYFKHPLEILEIWRGGLDSHGGAAGILIAIYFYARRRPDQPYLWVMDRIVVPTALGGAFIRLGNLFNSEILGTPTNVPWAFKFLQVDATPRHPVHSMSPWDISSYSSSCSPCIAVGRQTHPAG